MRSGGASIIIRPCVRTLSHFRFFKKRRQSPSLNRASMKSYEPSRPSASRTESPIFLTLEEVVERYRGQVSEGTLRNWCSMRIGPSFIKIGKAILYPLEELDRWDRRNLAGC